MGINILTLLQHGAIEEVGGLIPGSSNHTFLVRVSDGEEETLAIYKPKRGERPLWDFPEGTLYLREMAASVVSEALGWELVPSTVLRDGPYGVGAVQLFIEHDLNKHYFTFEATLRPQVQRIALFDHVVNNADRKAGHCLVDDSGHVWGIDHGICFHAQPKLRTVIWEFAGERIPAWLLSDLRQLQEKLRQEALQNTLAELLAPAEIEALNLRLIALIQGGTYPHPTPGDHYPWPPI